jgi:hypothetical protein
MRKRRSLSLRPSWPRLWQSRLAAACVPYRPGRYASRTQLAHLRQLLNALRLHAIPVRHKIDVADMVWLQLVKIGDPQFYNWVETYLIECAA